MAALFFAKTKELLKVEYNLKPETISFEEYRCFDIGMDKILARIT